MRVSSAFSRKVQTKWGGNRMRNGRRDRCASTLYKGVKNTEKRRSLTLIPDHSEQRRPAVTLFNVIIRVSKRVAFQKEFTQSTNTADTVGLKRTSYTFRYPGLLAPVSQPRFCSCFIIPHPIHTSAACREIPSLLTDGCSYKRTAPCCFSPATYLTLLQLEIQVIKRHEFLLFGCLKVNPACFLYF